MSSKAVVPETRGKNADKKRKDGTAASGNKAAPGSVGEALRAVYQDAVAEAVPDEMLDLLNKLG